MLGILNKVFQPREAVEEEVRCVESINGRRAKPLSFTAVLGAQSSIFFQEVSNMSTMRISCVTLVTIRVVYGA